jgi:ParB family chromosome partitioning protein
MNKQIEYIDIEKLIPYVNNAKLHSEEQIDLIVASIKEFGFINPVLIDKDNVIIAGHGRLAAAKKRRR